MSKQPDRNQGLQEWDIVNPIDLSLAPQAKADQLHALSIKNKPFIDNLITLSKPDQLLFRSAVETSKAVFETAWSQYLRRTDQTHMTVTEILNETDKLTSD